VRFGSRSRRLFGPERLVSNRSPTLLDDPENWLCYRRPMPLPDIDKWRAAKLLIDQYGNAAVSAASQRAQEMLAIGDVEGHAIWLAIRYAVEELQRNGPQDGERLN
jgi:hypothetical protein